MSIGTDWLGVDVAPSRNVGGRPAKGYKARGNVKLSCVSCGFFCRTSTLQISEHGAPFCACGAGPLSIEDPRERVAAEESAELERIDRVAMRRDERERNAGFETRSVNCAVCGRFKSRPADVCEYCGDDPVPFDPNEQHERRIYNRGYGYSP